MAKHKSLNTKSKKTKTKAVSKSVVNETELIADIRALITSARQRVAVAVNSTQTLLNWHIGRRLFQEDLEKTRAAYGKKILSTVSQQLTEEYGRGFSLSALYKNIRFYQLYQDEQIVSTLSTELSWSHFMELLPIEEQLAREFYTEMCRIERWNIRTMRKKIGGMLYERTALSKKPKKVVSKEISNLREGKMTPETVFRDPYLLEFLGLKDVYSEHDLEQAILREMESFLLELGSGFSFVARQKRMSVGKDDFHLDLLFYHRHLRRLVAIELKLESFQPSHVGQMEFYLRWLEKHEQAPGEKSPIGIILCASADEEQVELLQLGKKSIRVSKYLTELPPPDVLRKRLHLAIENARELAARREKK